MVERSQTEVWRLAPWLMIALLLANFVLMAFDAKVEGGERVIRTWTQTVADFVQSPVATVSTKVSNYFASVASLRSAQTENDDLKRAVQELQVQLNQSKDLDAENKRLRQMLGLKESSKITVLTARIIGRDPSVWFDSAIVNLGSLNGVRLNMPVVTDGGVIGRVSAVGPLTSQIDLITRKGSGVAGVVGQVGDSGALGVVAGTGKADTVEMKYVSGSTPVEVGQQIFTTGQDDIYPAGLKIGEIVSVISGSATTPHQIIIQPAGRLGSMQEVGILLYEPPDRGQFEQKLNPAKQTKK